METSSELEKIAKQDKKPNSLKHKLKVLAVAVPLALMSIAPAAFAQDTHVGKAKKQELITATSYTDLRGTYGASVSLWKRNNETGKGFRVGLFVEPKKSQNIHYAPFSQYQDDFYWDFSSEKLSFGATADWLIGKPGGLLFSFGGGLGLEYIDANNNLHNGIIIIDSAFATSSNLEEYIYPSGITGKVFPRVQASASYPIGKKLLLGIQAGADFGRRPNYDMQEFVFSYPGLGGTPSPKHRNNLILGLSLTYVIK